MKVLRLMLLSILVVSFPVRADDWLMFSCCSKHWRVGEHSYNEDNHGLSLIHTFPDKNFLMVGGYRNSFSRQSAYVGFGIHAWDVEIGGLDIQSGVMIGGVTGYGNDEGERNRHSPFLLPTVRFSKDDIGAVVMGAPGIMLGLGIEFRIP